MASAGAIISRDQAHGPAQTRRLLDRIDELEEQVLQLKQLLAPPAIKVPLAWRLSVIQCEIYRHLASRQLVTRESLMVVLYGHRVDDPPEPKIIDVMIHKLRNKLSPHGVQIDTIHGVGFALRRPS